MRNRGLTASEGEKPLGLAHRRLLLVLLKPPRNQLSGAGAA